MKKLLFLFSLCSFSFSLFSQEILCKHYSLPLSFGKGAGGEAADSLRSDTVDILKTTINFQITDFTGKTISGSAQINFVPKMNGVAALSLDLLKLTVDSVKANGANLTYSYNDTVLVINLPSVKNIGDTSSVTVFYRGAPKIDASGWGGFYFTSSEAYNLGVGFAADPHNYGRVWFPCFDNFVERCQFEFNITTNGGKIAYCNGTLAKDTTDANGFRTRTFILDETIPSYLAMVAVGNYAQVNWSFVSVTGDTIPLILSDIPSDTTKLKNSFVNLKNAVAAFENSFGPYRWKKMGYAIVPFSSGAMEHATNVTYPRPFIQGNTNYEDVLMAHELAHQWWGDLVTCRSAEDMWINEGMATYSQFVFNEWVYGMNTYKSKVRSNHEELVHYLHIKENGYRAISGVPHSLTYSDHTYLKGADVAHTMRGYLGDSLFFTGLKYVLSNNAFSDLSAEKFRDDMTFATGVNMNDFFSAWVFNGGWPQFSVDSFTSVPNGGSFDVTVHIKQKLDGAPTYFSNVPLEITFKDAAWNESVKSINVSGKNSSATVTLPFDPVFAGVDLNEKISDAITSDMRVIKAAGNYFSSTANGRMQISVQAVSPGDSVFLLVEHNWVYPDSFKIPNTNFKLSPYRYWKVSGLFPSLFDAAGTITYDGRLITSGGGGYLDHQLLTANNQEDSIVLLYRKNAGDDWAHFPYYTKTMSNLTDKFGTIKIDSLLPGEYSIAFAYSLSAISEDENENAVVVYPNPSKGKLQIKTTAKISTLNIFNLLGETVYSSSAVPYGHIEVELAARPGIYFYQLTTEKGIYSGKIILQY